MTRDFDVTVIGSGFGGSLMALVLRRLGYSVLLVESGKHPRFAIGESTSPLTNLILEQIAQRYALPRLLPLAQWGTWQDSYPQLSVGLKRGFTYYAQTAGQPFQSRPDRQNELLVAASPHNYLADTHWYRPDVDAFLVGEAVAGGAVYIDETRLTEAEPLPGGGFHLMGTRHGAAFGATARFFIDASGPRGFWWQKRGSSSGAFSDYPRTQSLYTHFSGVARTNEMPAYASASGDVPPYPADDAALHHVFEGGWMWVLRFNNGITSAGVSVESGLADELNLAEGNAAAWSRFLARFPTVREQFAQSQTVEPFRFTPQLSWRVSAASEVAGADWALLPSAAAFVDPLYSTGFPLMLLGIERLAAIFEAGLDTPSLPARLRAYAETTLTEADHTARFIAGNFRAFGRFTEAFVPLSQFYFAAASFSEMARRLHKPDMLQGYLAPDNASFLSGLAHASTVSPCLCASDVAQAIAPVNVAGLCDPAKRNWYGVDLADLIYAAPKLGETPDSMRAIIATAPWAQIP